MSTRIDVFSKHELLPTIVAIFAISLLAQIPHIFYLSDIAQLNQQEYLPLFVAFPIVSTLVVASISLLVTEYLLKRLRDPREKKIYRFILRGSLIGVIIYFICQFLFVFLFFQLALPIRDGLPKDTVDNITIKELVGLALVLIIGFFINPPVAAMRRRKKK